MLTPEQCRAKRNEFNAMARQAEKAGNPALERARSLAE
jgi:hypothetical protein